MKTSLIIILAFLLVGCTGSGQRTSLTSEQAVTLALRLANDKADTVFHHRPFQGSQPARFEGGRWVWTESRGAGIEEFQAHVEVSADGSTNSVDIQLLDNALRMR
jgi:hypothetical protein